MFFGLIIIGWHEISASALRINFTPSIPIGIYRLMPIPISGVRRGMLVAACPPLEAAEFGRRRGYLAGGACPANTEPLLKTVVAIEGDVVAVSPMGVAVNNCFLSHSSPLSFDRMGRRLSPRIPMTYRLRSGQMWLYADNVRSWDSRYWGPVFATSVFSRARPIWILRLKSLRGS
jgi:conjugative transfer signal peptidase TraF